MEVTKHFYTFKTGTLLSFQTVTIFEPLDGIYSSPFSALNQHWLWELTLSVPKIHSLNEATVTHQGHVMACDVRKYQKPGEQCTADCLSENVVVFSI